MNERLLQFIWQHQYFNKNSLYTSTGENLKILSTGAFNANQGPDFTNARIMIDSTEWAGSIELHLKTSTWIKHQHEPDPNYKNVILHVVWEDDCHVNHIPVFVLSGRVSRLLLSRYEELMLSASFIPCENSIVNIDPLKWTNWKDRLIVERMERRYLSIYTNLTQSNNHWEEVFWWLLARNFGLKVNSDAFEAIARSIPLKLLARNKSQIHQLESLLLGQAGLLEGHFTEQYPKLLQREYQFLKRKQGLQPIHQPIHFLRMRPGNFPTIRLSQLAALIQKSEQLFGKIRETESLETILSWLDVTANDYWHYHYLFDQSSSYKPKRLGRQTAINVVINTIIPILFAYGHYHKEQAYKTRVLQWLLELEPEKNSITNGFSKVGLETDSAFDSQAYLELKTQYCDKKNCLSCHIGNAILSGQG